jgi:hypothetical protein
VRGGRETRRDHEIVAARQRPHVGAVLIHDGETLAPLLLRPGLVDIDDAGVEKAFLAGDAGEDRVGDDMRDAARIIGVGHILLAGDLLPGRCVPEPEVGLQPPVAAAARAAGDDELRVDHLPLVHLRRLIRIGRLLDEALGIDRLQEHRATEIVGDDIGQQLPGLLAGEGRHRHRHRLERAAWLHVEIARLLGARERGRDEARPENEAGGGAAGEGGGHDRS